MIGDTQADLFAPPSGPAATVPSPRSNTKAAYMVWKATSVGTKAFDVIARRADSLARQGETRVSINALVEAVRAEHKAPINNTFRAWIADDLVSRWPHLEAVIERRRRKPRPL